jgi:hypothetical protein
MTHPSPMPDFVDALEARLRASVEHPRRRATAPGCGPMTGPVRVAVVAGLAAVAAIVGIVAASSTSQTQSAFGAAILRTDPVDISSRPETAGLRRRVGPTADLEHAWAAPALGGTAYLLRGADTWCVSAPDPATDRPDIERGVGCTDDQTFKRIGISIAIGRNFIAMIPDGVRHPVLRRPGAGERVLTASAHGVVVAPDLPNGSAVTLYDTHGGHRVHTIQLPDVVRDQCQDGTFSYRSPTHATKCPGGAVLRTTDAE